MALASAAVLPRFCATQTQIRSGQNHRSLRKESIHSSAKKQPALPCHATASHQVAMHLNRESLFLIEKTKKTFADLGNSRFVSSKDFISSAIGEPPLVLRGKHFPGGLLY